MRLVTYEIEHKSGFGITSRDGSWAYPLVSLDMNYKTTQGLIEAISDLEKQLPEYAPGQDLHKVRGVVPVGEVSLSAPISHPWQDVICPGVNYMTHAEESAKFEKEALDGEEPYTVYFSKQVNRAMDPGAGIPDRRDTVTDSSYEAELAVIIGREASRVKEEEVRNYIFGYTIISNVSARTLRTRHRQRHFGKGSNGLLPMRPCAVTVGELSHLSEVQVQPRVNGELCQDSNTEQLIFDIDHIASESSRGMILQPGTIIAMGTPAGVGMGFNLPEFLVLGDVMEHTIEGTRTVTNKVID